MLITLLWMKKIFLLVFCLLNTMLFFAQTMPLSKLQKDRIVAIHNFYRRQVGSDSLIWSDKLERVASTWLNHYIRRPLIPRNPYGYEQNFYLLPDTNFYKAIGYWAQEQVFYNGDYSDTAKVYLYQHYYRIINPEFQLVGCASARVVDGVFVFVCFYSH